MIHPDWDPNFSSPNFSDSHTHLTWWGERRKFYYNHWVQSHEQMMFQCPWCPQWVAMTDVSRWQCCALVITWRAVEDNVLVCKGSGQEKWSSGLREASPTNHTGDMANGYLWQACTPLRQWCDRIPILVIPILAIHPNRHPNLCNPSWLGSQF